MKYCLTMILTAWLLSGCYYEIDDSGIGTVISPTPSVTPTPWPTWTPTPSSTPTDAIHSNCEQQWCGNGSAQQPYLVHNLQQLHDLRYLLQQPGIHRPVHVLQMRDINALNSHHWHSGLGFLPLGQQLNGSSQSLSVVYDGNHRQISQLRMIDPQRDQVGLFAKLQQSEVRNLHVLQSNVHGRNHVAAVVGSCQTANGCRLANVSVSGQISGQDYVGGLVGGGLSDQVSITNSSSAAKVIGQTNVGGLAGGLFSGGLADNHSTSHVSGWDNIGGLVGYSNALIERSYSLGQVTLGQNSSGAAGGLAGVINGGGISDSYFRGQVSGPGFTGGLVGYSYQGALAYSYVAGSVSNQNHVSGPIQGSQFDSLTFGLYWDNDITGHSSSSVGTGLRSALMKESRSYAHWDFTEVWRISSWTNLGYPSLR